MNTVPVRPDDYLYDVKLTRIDPETGTLHFEAAGIEFSERPTSIAGWPVGHIGRLRMAHKPGGMAFHAYVDQRLRRDPMGDDLELEKWGWRIGDVRIQVRAGILPGLDGQVVTRDIEILEIELPREFIDLCARRGVTPMRVLRAYVADLCELINWFRCPREDGYSSNGSDERMYAQMHFHRTFD